MDESEIRRLYREKVKRPPSYFKRYEVLPDCPVKVMNNAWGDYDFPRNWCILDFRDWMRKYDIKAEHLGYTCDTDPELEFLSHTTKTLLSYPAYDLHTIGRHFKDKFDFFLFNQTIEHLYNPFEAIKNIYEIIKPSGYVFTSVPTINIPHMTPIHFNGFTPMGLAMLFRVNGFEVVEMGQWGNYEYISKVFHTHSWPGYNTLNRDGRVSNEEQNVCQCWILCQKKI